MGFYHIPGLPPVDNIVYVSKNENVGPQGFSTITAALASISDNSVSNPYKIEVGPGIYVEDSLVMKSFVWVEGAEQDQTIIESSLGNHVIIGADMSGISKCLLTGATNSSQCAIYYASLTGTTNTAFYVEDCRLGENDYLVDSDASTAATAVFVENCKFGSIYPFNHGFLAENAGRIVIRNSTTTGLSAPFPDFVAKATGTNSQIVLNAAQIRSGSVTSDPCIHLADGGTLRASAVNIRGFGAAIFSENVGTGQTIDANAILCEGNTLDINIEHPDTVGTFTGSADNTKVFVDPDATFSVVFACNKLPSDGTGSVTVGSILQGDRYDRLANLSKLVREGTTLGAVSGGVISIDSGFDIEVDGGNGFLLDPTDEFVKEITWVTDTLTIPADSIRYIYVDTNSVIQQAGSLPSFETVIPLGRVSTNDTGIRFIEDTELDMQHTANKLEAIFRSALGPVFVSGAITTESGTRNLDVTAGSYFFGINVLTIVGGAGLTWQYAYRDGVGGWTEGNQTTVDNGFYDDGTGTLNALTAGFYTKHVLYAIGDGGSDKYFLIYGQNEYNSQAGAESGDLPSVPPYISDAVVRLAEIVVRQGQASIVSILDSRPRIGFSAAAANSVTDHGNLTGLLDDDHPQYLLVSGTREMTGNLDMGGQNIVDVNLVDGVDVSAHASRHLPNGADPLTTGTPSSVSTANSEGIANAFARQDHVHDIAVNTVDNTRLADMATQTIKGRTTAGTGDPQDLTATQATAILNNFVGDSGAGGVKGLVPAPASGDAAANKFLKADATWATVAAGDVTGPASSTDNAITRFDGTTGKLIQNSTASLDDSGNILNTSNKATGTGGAGFHEVVAQSSAPSTPASGFRLYADSTNRLSWKGQNGFVRMFDGTANTADRTYTLPDASGTIALTSGVPAVTEVQFYTANDTWTKPANAKSVHVITIGAGGGGGSGTTSAGGASCSGGAGGAGGSVKEKTYRASDLASSLAITVGAAGTGGASVGPAASAGNPGVLGGDSSFGTILIAYGGGGGSGGVTSANRAGGSGGGTAGAGITGSTGAIDGGLPNTGTGVGISGGGAGVPAVNSIGQPAEHGGASGGSSVGGAVGRLGGTSIFGGAAGGGGGGTNTTTTAFAGVAGGARGIYNVAGGGGGAGGAADGGAGTAGAAGLYNGNGGGGGGGSAVNTVNGGAGGAGGTYGAGGGGGGGARSAGTAVSGAGGSGSSGLVIVTTYF